MSPTFSASLLRLKLLDALRSGDTHKVDAIMAELAAAPHTTQTHDIALLKETVLHYAVQVAPATVLAYLVTNAERFHLDVNSQDPEGNTPLHLAAAALRGDVVKYLLALPNINDTIVNLQKQQPVELCRDPNIAQLMQFERAKFVERASIQLRHDFLHRDFALLEQLLVHNARALELLDINGADPDTGNTVLHEYIKKDDVEMVEWILRHGGDPFKRDKRGKLPVDLVAKNDALKKMLKLASKDSNLMDPVINTNNAIKSGLVPTYKGYLRKWTNFAQGYKLRYFVLDLHGVLSYYASQDDTNNLCRGLLNLSFAYLHLDSSEKLKFEIIGKNGIRWHLKANHPVETNRWVWTLQNAITIAKDNMKRAKRDPQSPTSPTPDKQSFDEPSSSRTRRLLLLPGRKSNKHKRSVLQNSTVSSLNSDAGYNPNFEKETTPNQTSPNMSKIKEGSIHSVAGSAHHGSTVSVGDVAGSASAGAGSAERHSDYNESDFDYDSQEDYESEDDDEDDSYEPGSETSNLVFENLRNQVSTLQGSLEVGITSLLELFQKVEANGGESSVDHDEIYRVASATLKTIHESFASYNKLIQTRDTKLLKRLDRQVEVNKLWENSIHQLEDEIAKREDKLAEYQGKKKQLKKYITEGNIHVGSGSAAGSAAVGLTHSDESNRNVIGQILDDSDDDDEFFDAPDERELIESDTGSKPKEEPVPAQANEQGGQGEVATVAAGGAGGAAAGAAAAEVSSSQGQSAEVDPNDEGSVAKKVISSSLAANELQAQKLKKLEEEGTFLGYEDPPRTKLAMDEDNRPKVGLWGILKSMIGKDMTKMTLPVSFNECTSLLQRLAEDIEYSPLLDTAALYDDSTLRMVYVAAFGASEYALTINRIAKPFNPLLGETFEYCRTDGNYRLLVEQVSHHPPISACSAESPKWDYYGENAVDSQFRGRSFDFKHLGKMFCAIRPDNGVIDKHGKRVAEELYSWKKVNTSVVGIIVGNPTVDNFGKMEVTNHTTGDTVVLDLKQRGWRASSAYQLLGHVVDAKGKTHWAVGGHWNSRIFAKKVNDKPSGDRRNSLIETELVKESSDPQSGAKFLVWEAAPRPKVPFNLTQFAITLNDNNAKLIKWVAPTDTRLRPDQRAMEEGQYDRASNEKHRVEEKQRAAKKAREAKGVSYKPNWFIKKKHPITGETYWEYNGEYWRKRKNHELEGVADIF